MGWLKEDIENALYHDRFLLASKFHELVPPLILSLQYWCFRVIHRTSTSELRPKGISSRCHLRFDEGCQIRNSVEDKIRFGRGKFLSGTITVAHCCGQYFILFSANDIVRSVADD